VKQLLDTHAFLWLLAGDARLGAAARRRIEDPRHETVLSIASIWEMAIKVGLGKLRLGPSLDETIQRGARDNGIGLLAISAEHAIRVADLPPHHRDPFDRLLVAQALHEGIPLLANDPAFDAYGVARIW
jgi:PIN domain nuclease of toxin-antitoxin system